MADGKKSFVLYCDQIHAFEALSDIEAGVLIKHIFRYVNDQNPQAPDRITEISFAPIKQQLKRDLKDWEARKEAKSRGGKNSAAVRKQLKEVKDELSILKTVQESSKSVEKNARLSSVNVNVNVNDIIKQPEPIIKMTGQDFIDFKAKLKSDALFIENLVMTKIKREDLDRWINAYHIHISGEDKLEKNYAEYKRHFKNWMNKQDTNVVPVLLNGSNGKTTPNYIKSESEIDWDKYRKK